MSQPNPLVQTAIAAMVTATSQFDTFATHHYFYAVGGIKKVDDATDRLAITTARRESNLTFVLQADTGHWWRLQGGTDNANWVDKGLGSPFDGGVDSAGDVPFDDDSTTIKGTDVQAMLENVDSEIGNKTNVGHNHDDRYYTDSEADALFVALTGAQTIAGEKTFTDAVTAKRKSSTDVNASAQITLEQANKRLFTTNASGNDITITIPLDSTLAFAVGTEIEFVREGQGEVAFAVESGVTLNSDSSLTKIGSQYGAAMLIKRSANTWYLIGNLA